MIIMQFRSTVTFTGTRRLEIMKQEDVPVTFWLAAAAAVSRALGLIFTADCFGTKDNSDLKTKKQMISS